MINEIIDNVIDTLIINKYEETILTKCKYNFRLSKKEKIRLLIIEKKIKMLKLIGCKI